MNYDPGLLDALALIYARAAVKAWFAKQNGPDEKPDAEKETPRPDANRARREVGVLSDADHKRTRRRGQNRHK